MELSPKLIQEIQHGITLLNSKTVRQELGSYVLDYFKDMV